MNYQIHITKKAEQDLEGAADYIEFTLLNPDAADALLDKAEEKINSLSYMPQTHQLVDDPVLAAWEIRFILVNNYIAFFIIDKQAKIVHIVRFLYQKRNWIQILKTEPLQLD